MSGQLFYLQGNWSPYPLNTMLDGPKNFEVEGTSVPAERNSLSLYLIPYRNHRTDCPLWRQFFFHLRIFDVLEISIHKLKYWCTLMALECSRTWSELVWQTWNFTTWKPKKIAFRQLEFICTKIQWQFEVTIFINIMYRRSDKSLARPGRKQARKHFRDTRNFNNIETRAVIKFFFTQGKSPKEIHAILIEILACFLPGWAKDL